MRTVTKRDLNQHTAHVLDQVTDARDVVVTERGEPRWRVSMYRDAEGGLARLEQLGRYTPPTDSPEPWPDRGHGPEYTGDQVDALLDEAKGDH